MTFAHWRKCDFQVHTPRDPNWQGIRPIGLNADVDGVPATAEDVDQARMAWANELVDRCVSKGLEAIAITDHHEMVMFPYVKKVIDQRLAADPSFSLWVFPGMELTAHGGVQALIIFDADLSEDWRRQAQGKLGIVYADLEEKAAQSPRVTQLVANYADIGTELDSLGEGIRGKYIILPNVSQGGHHTVLKDGHHNDFCRMPYVGGYLDNGQNVTTLQPRNLARLSGTDRLWGSRYIYPLPTSDARSADYSKLGDNDAWIKLAAPTAEAIRQAFLGHPSRISIARPSTASLALTELRLRGSVILRDTILPLSPELNSAIGGRGSGKSSLLEYMAFGLGRSCYDFDKSEYSGTARMSSLIKDTVVSAGGEVGLTLVQDGAEFKIDRTPGNAFGPKVTYPNGSSQVLTTKELRSLFPAVVYSQGELSELGKQAGRRTQLADLLQFVDPSCKKQDDKLAADIENAKLNVRAAVQKLVSVWTAEAELRRQSTARDSLVQRIGALQKTLPVQSEEDQRTVATFEALADYDLLKRQATNHIDATMAALSELKKLSEIDQPVNSALDATGNFRDAYARFAETLRNGAANLSKELKAARGDVLTASNEWKEKLGAAQALRDGVMEKLGEHKNVTGQILTLQQEASAAAAAIGDLRASIGSSDDHANSLTDAINVLKAAVQERGVKTSAWANQIEVLSSGKIKADIDLGGDFSDITDAMDVVAAKTGSQEATRLKQIADKIAASSAWAFLDEIRTDCLATMHWKLLGVAIGGEAPACAALYATIGSSDRTKNACAELMDIARLEAIATATPKADVALSYCDGDRRISFEKASEGQRAAALLFMLLEQPGGPLLVDQPEGDLDNKIISDLTEKLHAAKQNRQIIFASHNANIVVNGSSELVVHLEVKDDGKREFTCAGAIDELQICKTITETMEGGEKAFRDRKSKYGY